VGCDVCEEIAEPCQGKVRLALAGSTVQDPHPSRRRATAELRDDRRLADPRLAAQDEPGRTVLERSEEILALLELALASDEC
jgi:hypothetical protein